ncbi:hypothetical protein D5018_11090 [Parashewanella curva]|uniref:Uncharacterized protein n=1 Tax=Parashewanella curva TaxID=2338552 RepID=A0A3L8PW62_9GAMM|nr:hypothetical protein [Parashewanella curva]RLV59586.1 hypothetical protein D5018_11090 [Parashewanella curva]
MPAIHKLFDKKSMHLKAILCMVVSQFSFFFSMNLYAATPQDQPKLILTSPQSLCIKPNEQALVKIEIDNTDSLPNFEINGKSYYTVTNLPGNYEWVGNGLLYTNDNPEPNDEVTVMAYLVYCPNDKPPFCSVIKSQTATIKITGDDKQCPKSSI